MRPLLLLTDSNVYAGTERHILDLAMGLNALACPVTVAAPGKGMLAQKAAEAGIPIWPLEKRGRFGIGAIAQLSSALRAGRFGLVHAHNGRTTFIAVMATLLAGRGNVVTTQHFTMPAHAKTRGIGRRLKGVVHSWMNSRISKIIAISDSVAKAVRGRREDRKGRLVQVWHGIQDPMSAKTECESPQFSTDDPTVVKLICPARLEAEKGHEVLFASLKLLNEQTRSWRCLLAGSGDQQEQLTNTVHSAGLAEQVKFLGFRSDVLCLIAESDVLVLPTSNEGFGLVLVEAMALGKPVVAMAAGGPLDIVEHDVTGLLVLPGDAAELASALHRLMKDNALRQRLGKAGRARYLQHFTAERMARETLAVYEEVIAGKPESRGQ